MLVGEDYSLSLEGITALVQQIRQDILFLGDMGATQAHNDSAWKPN
jgi:hypothetical protein